MTRGLRPLILTEAFATVHLFAGRTLDSRLCEVFRTPYPLSELVEDLIELEACNRQIDAQRSRIELNCIAEFADGIKNLPQLQI